jgi:putative ABC transport system permease protein
MYHIGMDDYFLPAYDLKIIAGRPYSKEFGEDVDRKTLLFNETAIRTMGFESPEAALYQKVIRGRSDTFSIVGVTADFHHLSLQKGINPVVFMYYPDSRSYYSFKIDETNTQALIASVESIWTKHFPHDPFTYFFLDEFYNKQYASDIQFGRVFSVFSLMAILVACLGLLGLSSYQIIQRTKEIGIRKVLGATTGGIVGLLSKDFLKLVLVSFIIATPVAYFVMQKWLSDYAYRIDIPIWTFAFAGIAAFVIAFVTVSAQSMRAALTNPVASLRSE